MRVLLLVLVAAAAAAQAAPLPTQQAELTLTAAGPATIKVGGTATVAVEVTLTAEGFACVQAGTLRVALATDSSKAAEGVVLIAANATTVALAAGAVPPGAPVTLKAPVNASLLAARYAPGGATSEFTLTAEAVAVEPENTCTLDPAGLAASAKVSVKVEGAPPGDPAFHPEHEAHGGYAFDKVLQPGASYTWTPTEAGRYYYHDHFHPEHKGVVRVLRVAEGAATPTIRLSSTGFSPSDVAVKVGTTVTWTNTDSVPRTVSADEAHDAGPVTEAEDAASLVNKSDGGEAPMKTPGPAALGLALAALAASFVRARR